jgi:hypothetical protein
MTPVPLFDPDVKKLVKALRPFADIADRMDGHRGESPLWAVVDECRHARAVLAELGASERT